VNTKEVRLECYKIAGDVKGLFSALKVSREDLATELADFCESAGTEDDDLYVAAIRIAVSEADRRAPASSIIERSKEIIAFASPPPPKAEKAAQGANRQGRGRGRQRQTSR
jgi:hypothetical protein